MHPGPKRKKDFFSNPTRVVVLSFAFLVALGSVLLMMPFSSREGFFTEPLTAIFTAVAASCVTGLSVVDTYSYWTTTGQVIILVLAQVGGLGLITLTTFFNASFRRKVTLRSMQAASHSVSTDEVFNVRKMVSLIIKMTFSIELAGAIVLAITFIPRYGVGNGIYYSVFTSVSAFCNAGIDVFGFIEPSSSLTHFASTPGVLIPVMLLAIIGGLGFVVWSDVITFRQSRRLMLHTKIVLVVSAILLIGGAICFFCFEYSNPETIGNFSLGDKVVNSFFQSAVTRTAGFQTFDNNNLTPISTMLSMGLMLIGGAPGSTAGGIKVTTFVVIIMTVYCFIRGKDDTIINGKRVSKAVVYKSLSVLVVSVFLIFISASILYFTQSQTGEIRGIHALYEAIYAFSTTGMTTGVAAMSNTVAKITLLVTMFVGRVGPMSLALSLSARTSSKEQKQIIPEGRIMVG